MSYVLFPPRDIKHVKNSMGLIHTAPLHTDEGSNPFPSKYLYGLLSIVHTTLQRSTFHLLEPAIQLTNS